MKISEKTAETIAESAVFSIIQLMKTLNNHVMHDGILSFEINLFPAFIKPRHLQVMPKIFCPLM